MIGHDLEGGAGQPPSGVALSTSDGNADLHPSTLGLARSAVLKQRVPITGLPAGLSRSSTNCDTTRNNATLNVDTPPKRYSDYVRDPYADLEVPAASPCDVVPQLVVDCADVRHQKRQGRAEGDQSDRTFRVDR